MKRLFSLLITGTLIGLLVIFAFAQVPASFIRSNFIIGQTAAQIGSGLVLVEEHTASGTAEMDFTTCITSTYDDYMLDFVSVVPATNATELQMQVSTNGGSSYDTGSNYAWAAFRNSAGGTAIAGSNSDTSITLTGNGGPTNSTTTGGIVGSVKFFSPQNGVFFPRLNGIDGINDGGASPDITVTTTASYKSSTAVNAFRFRFSSGNVASGTVRCYGLAK